MTPPALHALAQPATPSSALNPAQLAALRADMEAALAKVATRHGVSRVVLEGHRMHKGGFNVVVRVELPDFDYARTDWELHAQNLGLDPAWLNAVVRCRTAYAGREYEITGLRARHGAPRVRLRQLDDQKTVWMRLDDFRAKATLVRPAGGERPLRAVATPAVAKRDGP